MMKDIEKRFLEELTTLLKKYNADISIEEYINGYPEIAIYGCKDGEYFTINRKYFDGELLGYRIIST